MAIESVNQPLRRNSAAALGLFDGVHIGHQAVLKAAVTMAEQQGLLPCAFTFDSAALPVKQGKVLQYLYSEQQKQAYMDALGIRHLYCPDFSVVHTMDGESFCREILCGMMQVSHVFCGSDFRFGAKAAWNFQDLCRFGAQMGFAVHEVAPVRMNGDVVSSTAIRQHLLSGQPEAAAAMLGRPYSLRSIVSHGNEIGRTISFPTINQPFQPGQLVPKYGVYVSLADTPLGSFYGVTNVGIKPTIHGGEKLPLAETHLLDFSGNLYDMPCEVQLLHFLRSEQKFGSLAELQQAIALDCTKARAFAKTYADPSHNHHISVL